MSDMLRPGRAQPGRVFDVRRPGRAPATATSRPIIVGNKSEVQDPMNVPVSNVTPSAPEVPAQVQSTLQDAAPQQAPQASQAPQDSAVPQLHEESPEPVVADAANALHPPEEPLLLSRNTPEPADETPAPALSGQNLPVHEDQLPDLHQLSPLTSDHQDGASKDRPVVSHHRRNWVPVLLKTLGVLALVALLAVIVLDILMDGGFVVLKGVPHTHFF